LGDLVEREVGVVAQVHGLPLSGGEPCDLRPYGDALGRVDLADVGCGSAPESRHETEHLAVEPMLVHREPRQDPIGPGFRRSHEGASTELAPEPDEGFLHEVVGAGWVDAEGQRVSVQSLSGIALQRQHVGPGAVAR
jgi:hypothetical protein